MSSRNDAVGVNPTLVQGNAFMNVSFDQFVSWTPCTNSGVPIVVTAYQDGFKPNDISFYSNDQYYKLLYMYNLYQHFRISNIKVKWVPLFRNPQSVAADNTYLAFLGTQEDAQAALDVMQIFNSIFVENGCITMLQDSEDLVTRSNLDEYYQVRAHPRARNFSASDTTELNFAPTVLELASYNVVGQNQNSGQIQATVNTNVKGDTNSWSNTNAEPTQVPWQSTKVASALVTSQPSMNMQQQMFGLKWYIYTPFNRALKQIASEEIGILSYSYSFEFKDQDTRALTSYVTMEDDIAKRTQITMLRKLKGDKALLYPHRSTSSFVTPAGLTAMALAEQTGEPTSLTSTNKRARPNLTDGQTPPETSSQQTPPVQTARTPLARLGLTRNG